MQTIFPTSITRRGALIRQLVAASLFGALMLAPVAGFVFATDFGARSHSALAFNAQSVCRSGEISCNLNSQAHSSPFSNR
ncbi:hypothetical protein [Stappia sp. 28M-7]|jgi:hypothetical protein|uniref:hypothetical protein n=1 Tax=Stappia sp. 28M-7 TaxID=2762596 RepID=UPI000E710A0C|nr:hypothetical protein [Stappia sp. 28M-7]MBC2859694.1 hypothetical protein [Stappia sp. 28M-7]